MRRLLWIATLTGCSVGLWAQNQTNDQAHDHSAMDHSKMTPAGQAGSSTDGMDHAVQSMSSRHMDMGPHMKMTALRAPQPGDQQRADAIAAEAKKALEHYRDYKVALAEGFHIFLPNLPQKMYHFTNYTYAFEAAFRLNPEHPTSLLYEKTKDGGWKLIGAMYTAPVQTSEEELNERIPLSIAQWHQHTNFCAAPKGQEKDYFGPKARFGLLGSITTQDQCKAAGGVFRPVIFGWMVHVYPFEKTQAEMWSVERPVLDPKADMSHMNHAGHEHSN